MMTHLRRFGNSKWNLLLCACVGAVSGLGVYTFWYGQGGSYFSSNPKACVNCHIMRDSYDGWQHGTHHAHATCVDCHLPHDFVGKYIAKAENGFWHSKGFTLQDFAEPIRIKPKNSKILLANCIRCHGGLVGELSSHGAFEDGSNNCVRCHASVGHGPVR